MDNSIPTKTEAFWGRKAVFNLFCKFNCPEATMQTCQEMHQRREDNVLKAAAGLVAGVKGSTCGVVSGGALCIALQNVEDLNGAETGSQARVLSHASDFVGWFEDKYGTTTCRGRSRTDFWTLNGVLAYLLPGHKMLPCLSHINGSLRYLRRTQPAAPGDLKEKPAHLANTIHCAQSVLRGILARTGTGDPVVEKISLVLDGGVALSGGLCGALAGAAMAINLRLGDNLRDVSLPGAYYRFFKGVSYLRSRDDPDAPNPFNGVRKITGLFEQKAGSINCQEITERRFTSWDDFQSYIQNSSRCQELIDFTIEQTSGIMERLAAP